MRSFARLALLALPLFNAVCAEQPASSSDQVDQSQSNSIYASAHEAFQDLLNALPEESLQAALSGLKDFKDGVFESHHRGVEHVHDSNPALATKLIVAAVHDLKKRQAGPPTNGTTTPAPPPPPQSSNPPPPPASSRPPTVQSSGNPPPPPPPSSTERPVVVPVETTTTDNQGRTIVSTTSVLSEVTASVEVTVVRTNSQGNTVTQTENRPAVIMTTTDSAGRTTLTTSAANFAPTAGEVLTTTDDRGSVVVTTYTPGSGKISSIKLITTTGADGQPSVVTSYTVVDPATQTGGDESSPTTKKPGLQTNAANKNLALGYAAMGGALAFFV